MKFRIEINQKEIIESGIKGVKIQEWLLFDVVRHMIGADWTKKLTVGEKSYAWISEQSILDQIPLLELSKRQVHRWVDTLVDAGLLIRYENNIGEKRVYLGLTPVGDAIGRHSLTEMTSSKDSACQKRQAQPDRNDKLSLTEMSGDKYIKEKAIKDNTESPTPLDGGSVEPPARLKKIKVKKRCTDDEAMEFYKDQLKDFPLPPEGGAVAPGPEVAYRMLVRWMFASGTGLKNGFRGTVLNMADQLAYDEYISLIKESGMSDYQLRQYLVRMHNWEERHKNKSIYWVIKKWYRDDLAAGKTPPRSESAANEPERKVAKIVQRGPIGD